MAKNIDNSVKEKNDQYAHEEVGIQPWTSQLYAN